MRSFLTFTSPFPIFPDSKELDFGKINHTLSYPTLALFTHRSLICCSTFRRKLQFVPPWMWACVQIRTILSGIMHSSLCDAACRYSRGTCQGLWWIFVTWLFPSFLLPSSPSARLLSASDNKPTFFKSCVLLSKQLSQVLHQCSTQVTFWDKTAAWLKLDSLVFLYVHFLFSSLLYFVPGLHVFLVYSLLLIIKIKSWCWLLHLF